MFGMDKIGNIGDILHIAERFTPLAERAITIAETVINSSGVKEKYAAEGSVSFDFTLEDHRVFVRVENLKKAAIPVEVTEELIE